MKWLRKKFTSKLPTCYYDTTNYNISGYQKKFKADGSSEDYTKIFRYSSFPSIGGQWNYSYGNNSDTVVRNSVVYNNAIWHLAKHDQLNDQTSGFNYYRDVPAIYKTTLNGALSAVYMVIQSWFKQYHKCFYISKQRKSRSNCL